MESFVISVSVGTGCYRHIQIGANATLYKLHEAIIEAFEFMDDHEHAFFMDNHIWMPDQMYVSTKLEPGDRPTKKYTLKKLGLKKGMAFKYVFDFGDEWRFQCKVLRELDEKTDIPCIIRSVGESPEQYPDYEEWDEDGLDSQIVPIDPKTYKSSETDLSAFMDDRAEWVQFDYDGFPERYPEERTIKALQLFPMAPAKWSELWEYFDAAARLYGVIPLRKLLEIYNQQNEPISADIFLRFAEILRHESCPYSILNCDALKHHAPMNDPLDWEIVAQHVYSDDIEDYYSFTELQADKPYYIPVKNEFLRYADEDYYPQTTHVRDMRKFLNRVMDSREAADDILLELQDMISIDIDPDSIFRIVADDGLDLKNEAEIEEFLSLFVELSNHTRKCTNRGNTPSVLYNQAEKERQKLPLSGQMNLFDEEPISPPHLTIVGTPSRNAPCPCGSGRKYKNCCGKLPN